MIHLCWEAERLRAAAARAGASDAARSLAEARDTLLTAAGPAQLPALLSLRRSTR